MCATRRNTARRNTSRPSALCEHGTRLPQWQPAERSATRNEAATDSTPTKHGSSPCCSALCQWSTYVLSLINTNERCDGGYEGNDKHTAAGGEDAHGPELRAPRQAQRSPLSGRKRGKRREKALQSVAICGIRIAARGVRAQEKGPPRFDGREKSRMEELSITCAILC